jgi:hypothetical protein
MRHLTITGFAIAIGLTGCILIDDKKEFELPKDTVVGQSVDQTRYSTPDWKKKIGPDRIEYGYKDYRGCSWAIEVVEQTLVIVGWRYISDPKLCWTHVPSA